MLIQIKDIYQQPPGRPPAVENPLMVEQWRAESRGSRRSAGIERRDNPEATVHELLAAKSRPRGNPVYAVPEDGKPRLDFPAINVAAEAIGASASNIKHAVSTGGRANGRWWRLVNVPESEQPPLKPGYSRPVIVDGVRYESAVCAAKALRTKPNNIHRRLQSGTARYA